MGQDAENQAKAKGRIADAINFDLAGVAGEIIGGRTEEIAKEDLARLRLIALPLLETKEIIELTRNSFTLVSSLPGYSFWGKLRNKLISIPELAARDTLKKSLRDALLANNEALTEENCGAERGTVRNWLLDYNRALGTGKIEALKLREYLINSANTKKLRPESRQRLEALLKLYEKLKVSSLDILGTEENIIFNNQGELAFWSEGLTERIGNGERKKSLPEGEETKNKIIKIYQGDEREEGEIKKEESLIANSLGALGQEEKGKKLTGLLIKYLDRRNKIGLMAVLRLAAREGRLGRLALEDKNLNNDFLNYLKIKGANRLGLVEGFRLEPGAPIYVSLFLQYLLSTKLGLGENDAGRWGAKIATLAAKTGNAKYGQIAYFDLKENKFKWSV